MNNHQKASSKSKMTVGRIFENKIHEYFLSKEKIDLERQPSIKIGVSNFEKEHKEHKFDLISREEEKEKIIIECKCHKWRKKINVPSGKMTIWNEAMYYFLLLPKKYKKYKKYLVVPKDYNYNEERKRKMTLAQYYISQYKHLIPEGVNIFEYDEHNNNLEKVF